MKKLAYLTSTWTMLVALLGTSLAPALAAPAVTSPQAKPNSNSGQALEIAPPVINLTVNPGQTVKTQVFLRNISSGSLIVTGQANDFVAAGQDGTPKLLLKDEGTNNPYSLKAWIAAPASLTIVPKEIKTMSVTITVPANASPGGHYGVIRFTASPADLQGSGVSLSASLGALILVTVNGKISENLAVNEFSISHAGHTGSLFESSPLQFTERLKNNGNVHVRPVGQVTITNMFGKKVAAVNVNLPPGNILPASIRKFDQPLDKTVLGNKRLFGRYHAVLKVDYGTGKKTLTDSRTFWVLPYRLMILLAVLLVAGFLVLRILIKRYNQRIISKAQGPDHNPDNK